MKIKFNRVRFDRTAKELILSSDDLQELLTLGRSLEPDVEYDLEFKQSKKKRSLDANAYAWVLLGQLASALRLTTIEVYQQIVLDMHTYSVECIKEEDFERNKKEWERGHIGRGYELIGESKDHKGWMFVKKHRGTSDFSSKEMTVFLDTIIYECEQMGIDTRTPKEIQQLKEDWN